MIFDVARWCRPAFILLLLLPRSLGCLTPWHVCRPPLLALTSKNKFNAGTSQLLKTLRLWVLFGVMKTTRDLAHTF